MDSVEEAQENLGKLNDHVRKFFPNLLELDEHPVVLEFEKYFESLGVGCVKNRNAGLITWKDGKFLDEREFTMTGFTAKRVSETKLAKEVQIAVLNMWVENKDEAEIDSYLNNIYTRLLKGDEEMSMLTRRSRFKDERFSVKCNNCTRKNTLDFLMCSYYI